MRTQQGLEGGVPLPGGSCSSSGSGSSGLSPGSESDGGVDSMVDGGLGVGVCMGGSGGGGSLGGTLRGVLSRYWSLESLHSTTGKCLVYTLQVHANLLSSHKTAVSLEMCKYSASLEYTRMHALHCM